MRRLTPCGSRHLLACVGLLSLPACVEVPDLIVTAALLPDRTRWLDVIVWRNPAIPAERMPQTPQSRQLIDLGASVDAGSFYKIGVTLPDRQLPYAIFLAAFSEAAGVPCLLKTTGAAQQASWVSIADLVIPFSDGEIYPKNLADPGSVCLALGRDGAMIRDVPLLASVSIDTSYFNDITPGRQYRAKLTGWNFLPNDRVSATPSGSPPVLAGAISSPAEVPLELQGSGPTTITVSRAGDAALSDTITATLP